MYYLSFCNHCGEKTLHDFHTNVCAQAHPARTANRFHFVIFRNYDGSVESKVIPKETWIRINS